MKTWAMALALGPCLAGCEQLVVCNPENWCDGDTYEHCDLVCAPQPPKSTAPPKDCKRVVTKRDCAAEGLHCTELLGGPPSCQPDRAACDPSTTHPHCKDAQHVESCVLFSNVNTQQSAYLTESVACPAPNTCQAGDAGYGCYP